MSAITERWYCDACGIVRDLPEGTPTAWCRHNALDQPASRMALIWPGHPLATGPLPWGQSDPSPRLT